MATEAARLKSRNLQEGRRKTDLTHTGLLMEGLESIWRMFVDILICGWPYTFPCKVIYASVSQ